MVGCGASGIAVNANLGNGTAETVNIEFNTVDDMITLNTTSNGEYMIRGNIITGQIVCVPSGTCDA